MKKSAGPFYLSQLACAIKSQVSKKAAATPASATPPVDASDPPTNKTGVAPAKRKAPSSLSALWASGSTTSGTCKVVLRVKMSVGPSGNVYGKVTLRFVPPWLRVLYILYFDVHYIHHPCATFSLREKIQE